MSPPPVLLMANVRRILLPSVNAQRIPGTPFMNGIGGGMRTIIPWWFLMRSAWLRAC
jgi:hypothetical protein